MIGYEDRRKRREEKRNDGIKNVIFQTEKFTAYHRAEAANRNMIWVAGVRGYEAAYYPREASACEGQKLVVMSRDTAQ